MSNLTDRFKPHFFSIITAIIIAAVVAGYILLILPRQTAREDIKNRAVFNSIKQQLNDYIDDRVKAIDAIGVAPDSKDTKKFVFSKVETLQYYADSIWVQNAYTTLNTLIIERVITIKNEKDNTEAGYIKDTVPISLELFRKKIPDLSNFTSFYICQVYPKKDNAYLHPLLSENVSLQDQDSIWKYRRDNGPLAFKNSSKRYYSDHLSIPGTEMTLLVTAGVGQAFFQSAVRSVNPAILIVSLSLVIILMLSIAFVKPIVSSIRERLEQKDLVSVVFSIGALSAVVVVFCMVFSWDHIVRSNNERDLKKMAAVIDTNFTKQLSAYNDWITLHDIYVKDLDNKNFARLETGGVFKYLDAYFRMDKKGLIISDLNTKKNKLRRTYANRDYFKLLTDKTLKYDTILRAVFSRDDNEYQWIYAVKDKDKAGIHGIAFRPRFSDSLVMPPGTDYIIADKNGDVIMQSNPKKGLYQKLLQQTEDNSVLQNAFSGSGDSSFTMKYQGISYQAYAQLLDINKKQHLGNDLPLYIISIRNLSFVENLSIFTFSNGFLISLAYGFFVILFTLFYSALIHSGSCGFFSRKHFYYLFPDKSRTKEYKLLLIVNIASMLTAAVLSLFAFPSTALLCCMIIGLNTAFFNLMLLNKKLFLPQHITILLLLLILSITFSLILVKKHYSFSALLLLFIIHGLIIGLRQWYNRHESEEPLIEDARQNDSSFNRRLYNSFISVILLNHFAIFPFILCSSIYITELNDVTSWYCSVVHENTSPKKTEDLYVVDTNGCNCDSLAAIDDSDYAVKMADLHILSRPGSKEIGKFSMIKAIKKQYLTHISVYKVPIPILLILGFLILAALIYSLINYYGYRFFFYDLMLAYKDSGQHPKRIDLPLMPHLSNENLMALVEDDNSMTTSIDSENAIDTKKAIAAMGNQISVLEKETFIMLINLKKYDDYQDIWNEIPQKTRYILFDFARDNFVNYRNKGILIDLMDKQIIDCDTITGRLKIMNPNFREYIVSNSRQDPKFIEEFVAESEGEFFGKLKISIIIIVVSALVLLMYLNKDSYDKVALLGTGISTTLALVHKLLGFTKSS